MKQSASHRPLSSRRRRTATSVVLWILLVAGVFSAVSRSADAESRATATGNSALRDSIAHAALLRDRALSGSQAMAIVT